MPRNGSALRLATLILLLSSTFTFARAEDYKLGPDSMPQPGVPQGEVTHYVWKTSKVYPGTERDYWVYVPSQYDASKPACVMFFQDGGGFQDRNGGFRVPVVFDNLIHKKEMPVTIAVMINPGVAPPTRPNALPRFNRSYEYDAVTDDYARFLLDEILPEIGKKWNLSKDPNDRAICGASSGGICAFTTAWERPDQFRRVVSFIGSFTNLRGGHAYPWMIRKYEPRPLRVFMQDGSNDQDIYSGNWFIGNNDVAAALRFGRYDMQYVVGTGGHDGNQATAIFPDAVKWIWRGYPAPIKASVATPQPVTEILLQDEEWKPVSGPFENISAITPDGAGNLFVADQKQECLYKIAGDGTASLFKKAVGRASALAFGPDDRLYLALKGAAERKQKKKIVALGKEGKLSAIASDFGNDFDLSSLAINHVGDLYAADLKNIWLFRKDGKKRAVEESLFIRSIVLTPDQSLLLEASLNRFALSFRIQEDGSLTDKQDYFDVHSPYGTTHSGAEGMTTDTQGRLYLTSDAGIQIFDQAGRVIGILSNPERLPTSQITFGGPNLDTLYVVAQGRLFQRKTRAKGVLSFQEPIRPPAPRL